MSTADFQQLIWQARALSHGDAKVALLEEAVRMADSLGDVDAGYRGRMKLVEAATFAGHQERGAGRLRLVPGPERRQSRPV